MGISDEEIERAVASVTPTATATPAPAVLKEMRAAIRGERWQWRWRRLAQVMRAGSVPAAYVALALAIVALIR